MAADAPPIDVAMRQGTDRWDPEVAPAGPAPGTADGGPSWDSTGWQPPNPPEANGTPSGFWEGTDDWAPAETPATPETSDATPSPFDSIFDDGPVEVLPSETVVEPVYESPFVADWAPDPFAPVDTAPAPADLSPWTADEWPRELAGEEGPWDHDPDPEAVNTGFYVDWGTPETTLPADDTDTDASAWDTSAAWEPTTPEWETTPAWENDAAVDVLTHDDPAPDLPASAPDVLPPISWRADGPAALPAPEPVDLDAASSDIPGLDFEPTEQPTFEPELRTHLRTGVCRDGVRGGGDRGRLSRSRSRSANPRRRSSPSSSPASSPRRSPRRSPSRSPSRRPRSSPSSPPLPRPTTS